MLSFHDAFPPYVLILSPDFGYELYERRQTGERPRYDAGENPNYFNCLWRCTRQAMSFAKHGAPTPDIESPLTADLHEPLLARSGHQFFWSSASGTKIQKASHHKQDDATMMTTSTSKGRRRTNTGYRAFCINGGIVTAPAATPTHAGLMVAIAALLFLIAAIELGVAMPMLGLTSWRTKQSSTSYPRFLVVS
jgi:hypothetical protein